MADIKEAIRRLIYQYSVEGADKVMATQEAVAASTTKTDKASLSLEKSFGGLERKYVDTVRAQEGYAKVQEKVNAAVAQNPELQERANVVLAAAGQHFDNLASRAEKGSITTKLLSGAIRSLLGPAGLLGLAMTGIGTAIGYMAAQWQSSSTTVEQALTEQNRLMAESKKLIDEKTSAQERMFAQSAEVTTLQALQNETDLRIKLNEAMERTIALAEKRTTTPTQVPGEMGVAPTGVAPLKGYEDVIGAIQRLKEARAADTIGLKEFNTEIAKIALANPGIRSGVLEIIKYGDAEEQARIKAEALSAVLAGVATDTQRVAAGLKTIAETNFDTLKAMDAALAMERMVKAMTELQEKYPTLSMEGAKQVELLDAQLVIAKARTDEERLIAQEKLKVLQLTLQGVDAEEAALLASKERAITEANIARQKDEDSLRQAQQRVDAENRATEALKNTQRPAQQLANVAANTADGYQDAAAAVDDVSSAIQGATSNMAVWVQVIDEFEARYVSIRDMIRSNLGSDYRAPGVETAYDPLRTELQRTTMEQLYGAGNIEPIFAMGGAIVSYKPTQDYLDAQNKLADATEKNTSATDALNNTMQNALSPFYSQDPRTTHLGFRAGVVGNPEWMVGGASNENPLAAILGAGATAPGMAGGGSFMVGGGYSANDNKIAAFPVASGEEVIVNRNRKGGQGGQVIHIDNRTIINGRVDADVFAQMKHSKYQQTQRMRAGLAVA